MLCSDLPTLVVVGSERRVCTGRSEAPARWDLGKALRLLLALLSGFSSQDTRVASRSFWVGSYSKPRPNRSKAPPKRSHEPLEETSARTWHKGNNPKERNETVCWKHQPELYTQERILKKALEKGMKQFAGQTFSFTVLLIWFFSVRKIRHNCAQPWAVKQNTTGTEMTFFLLLLFFAVSRGFLNTHMCVEIQFL